jgi:hypothetical protein
MNYTAGVPSTIKFPYVDTNGDLKIELIKFNNSGKYHILQVGISNLEDDNYRLCLDGSCLSIIISEPLEYLRPIHVHNIDWKTFSPQSFDLIKQADIWLPGDNFYIIRHLSFPDDNVLEVILGRK